ncbi:MAG: ATP-binding protein [Chthoniobacterales bacterium]
MNPSFDQFNTPEVQMAYLASIVESSDDAIVGKNLQSIVTSWNKGAERVFGYTAEEMIGQSITRLIPTERLGEEGQILSRIQQGKRIDHFETIRVRKDGKEIEVSVTVSAIRNAEGTIIGASKVARDITLTKQAERDREMILEKERELREKAEKADRIKNEFLATLSHELRTPLSAILGWVQILRMKPPTPEDLQQGLEVIFRNTRVQSQLIEDLLDMNRILMGKVRLDVQLVNLPEIMGVALESVALSVEAKEIQLKTIIDPLAGPVRGDPVRLQQVIWNLLTNAIKFTPKGGKVEVVLERVNSHVEINISDTGIGIKPDFLASIFDRFSQVDSSTTRHYGGLGLGLSIVKHLTELQGGTVHAKSAGEGKGSTFRVHLPLPLALHGDHLRTDRQHPSSSPDMEMEWDQPNLTDKKVLIVDDDRDTAEVVKHLLLDCGAEATLVSSAKEALAMGTFSYFDVLISDIGMPDMDGFEFIRQVRAMGKEKGSKISAIALTAFSRPEDRKLAVISGFDVYLSKPADPQELVSLVDRFVKRDE